MRKRQIGRINLSDPKNPRIDLASKKAFQEDLKLFKHDSRCWLIVESYSPKRSLAQNSLIHLWFDEIATESGQDADEVKSTLKVMFAQFPMLDKDGEEQFNPQTGEKLMFVKDTSAMSKDELSQFMEKVQLFSLEFWGMELKSINEQGELRFKENY